MSPTGSYTATVEGGVIFWGNTTLRQVLTMHAGSVQITVRADTGIVGGTPPQLVVRLDGKKIGSVRVTAFQPKDYKLTTHVTGTASRVLEVALEDPVPPPSLRALYVAEVKVWQK